MNSWALWSVEFFVAAHFVALAIVVTHAAIVRRRERSAASRCPIAH